MFCYCWRCYNQKNLRRRRYRRNAGSDFLPIPRFPSRSRNIAHTCRECGEKTKEGKPYCPDHIHMMSYVERIQLTEAEMKKEIKAVARGKKIPDDSLVVNEIITALKVEGAFKQGELAKYLSIPFDVLKVYLEQMDEWEMVRLTLDGRTLFVEFLNETPQKKLTLKEIAEIVNLHPSTVRKLAKKGAPHQQKGRILLFNLDQFRQWYKEFRQEVAETNRQIRRRKARQLRKDIRKEKGALLTRQELAKELNVSISTVQHWVTKGVPHEEIDNPEYMGGKEGTKIRLFDLDQVIEWRKQFHEAAMEIRKTSQALGDEFWGSAIQFALDNSVAEASEKYGVSRGALTRKMREAGVETPGIVPVSERTLTRFEAAPVLGVKPVTIYKWVNEMGAPHDRVAHPNVKNRETILVNVDELREWKKHEDSLALKRKRERRYRQHVKILEFLAAAGPTSARQIALNTDMGPDKAKLRLAELVDLGKVVKTGIQASTKYSLPEHSQRRNPYWF